MVPPFFPGSSGGQANCAARYVPFSRTGAGLHSEARFSRSNGGADWYDRFISPHESSATGALNCDMRQSVLPGCHAEGELIAAPLLADSARLTYSTK